MMQGLLKKYLLPVLLLVSLLVWVAVPDKKSIQASASEIQEHISVAEEEFYRQVKDTNVQKALSAHKIESHELKPFRQKHIELFYYRNDTLATWTTNTVAPILSTLSPKDTTSLVQLKNGWYVQFFYAAGNQTVIGLLLIKHQYPFQNRFLKNDFSFPFSLPSNIEINAEPVNSVPAIYSRGGKFLFSIYRNNTEDEESINYIILLAQLILCFILLYYVHTFSETLLINKGFGTAFAFLMGALLILRLISLVTEQPSEFYKSDLFSPKLYASTFVTKSLGDLIINCLMLWWITHFYTTNKKSITLSYRAVSVITVMAITSITALIVWVFKTLVMDSVISFEVYNVLTLNHYSVLGLACIGILTGVHFLVARFFIKQLSVFSLQKWGVVTLAVVSGIAVFVSNYSLFSQSIVFAAPWNVLFIGTALTCAKDEVKRARNVLLFIALYSVLYTFLIENFYERRERNQREFFAGKLVSERDFIAEYTFEDIAARISSDAFVKRFFSSPFISKKEITDRLNTLYLNGYFNKYEVKFFAFDSVGNCVKTEDTCFAATFIPLIENSREKTLVYVPDTAQNYYYLSILKIADDTLAYGNILLKLTPKTYYGQDVYPEILLGSDVTNYNALYNYGYAIYKEDKLIAQYGEYPYTYYWNKDYTFGNSDYAYVEEPDWEHSIQRFSNGRKVVVTVAREPLFEPVATFSYLFTFLFLLLAVAQALAWLLKTDPGKFLSLQDMGMSFRTRINYSMLAMIVISFIIIGAITINFFSKQYNNFYSDRLQRKEKVIHASLEYFLAQNAHEENLRNSSFINALSLEVNRLAQINGTDINVYDVQGSLAVSSQPTIYEKGILSKKMNPSAYFELNDKKGVQTTQQEQAGNLSFFTTYSPLLNSKGNAIAYLGIPYFERNREINEEVSTFLVALMNVYVFLLIVAALLAFFISNSITRPLTIISEKLRILNLNKKNEPIEWNSKDEIGVLVNEYNKMITELEQSAQKLAKGERESAWREMAKQIAHEIKNPLTPMKLSIQYLQRAIDEGNPNVEQLARKVTKTLEEQIENLSSIATAFASFAKMPKPENEIIALNELLKSVTDLFNRENSVQVTFETNANEAWVFADKNQLISVFNNLIKNAIQSIPEERKGFVEVALKEEDGWILCSVKDNGSGISEESREKVFVPNFTTKTSGTGLGLAICKQIIDGAGGSIWFENNAAEGTTFYVRLRQVKPA